MAPLWAADATTLGALLREREISATELLEVTLARVELVGGSLNPFVCVLEQRARSAAARADREIAAGRAGPLCGIPVLVKDNIWIAGVRSTLGCRAYRDHVADRDACVVERLDAAGAVIVATTTTNELCLWSTSESPLHGRTLNPWTPDRIAGGSSSGSGAALAAGVAPLALGTDDGGSIRIPAACCGVVGHKPTFGRVPRNPGWPGGEATNAFGPMARTVADARLLLSVLEGWDGRDRHSVDARPVRAAPAAIDLAGLRLAYLTELGGVRPAAAVLAVFEDVLAGLRDAGATLEPVRIETDPEPFYGPCYSLTSAVPLLALIDDPALVEPATWAMMQAGLEVTPAEVLAAERTRAALHAEYLQVLNGADALIHPTLAFTAWSYGGRPAAIDGEPLPPGADPLAHVGHATITGLPACAVPVGLAADGLPASVQVTGRPWDDDRVLDVAAAIHAARAGHVPWPPAYAPA
jgi:Asp-tRNA(Asn)/Glu-tRNA(Gln) amidotransferase A subunit family amidase